nr:immunoglobulin heavy chain junction region [Mus musculus]MBK4196742.1 immunoglobulin heavy chain junction region [Mus musculus]MBK4196743.1 immunoglobulin heavy chain junction region [Mus musculus]MBK4196744.1 immunoglobulin heavy chain junction region [Mus musculus]MBK4196745.1 immunoglobulin heavy chain junction region [Mus musculus]
CARQGDYNWYFDVW